MSPEITNEPGAEPEPEARAPGQLGAPHHIAVAWLAVIAIMFLFVFPTRAYLAQQRQVRKPRATPSRS